MILLVGTAFNTSTFSDIKVGAYSSGYNDLSNSIVDKLQQDDYQIFKSSSEDECIKGVKTGAYHLCTIFPPNLAVSDSDENVIQVYVDQSRINLVFAIKSAIIDKVGETSKELSESLTSIVVAQLEQASASLDSKKSVLSSLKTTNEQFTSGIVTIETELEGIDLSTNLETEINNKTAVLKAQTNDTRTITELEDLIGILTLQLKAVNIVSSAIPNLKEIAIAESSQLADLDRASNKIIADIEAIKVKDVETLVSPIKTVTQPVTTERSHINYLFPTLIMMVVMFVSLLLSSITVIREKISPAYFRNYISPNKAFLFIASTYLTNILIIVLQLAIVFAVMLAIQPDLISTLTNVVVAILIITTAFILLGMIMGYLFSSEETATVGAISLGTILLFFSNTIIPLESINASIKQFVDYNMFVVSDTILRKLLIFEVTLQDVLPQIYILLGHIAVFLIAIAAIYHLSSKRYNIKRYFHK